MGATCNQCLLDDEAGDEVNILDGLQGDQKYQLKYRWADNKLIETSKEQDAKLPHAPFDEIICDGNWAHERNQEPRNFTLSLSAIKPIDQTLPGSRPQMRKDVSGLDPFGLDHPKHTKATASNSSEGIERGLRRDHQQP